MVNKADYKYNRKDQYRITRIKIQLKNETMKIFNFPQT